MRFGLIFLIVSLTAIFCGVALFIPGITEYLIGDRLVAEKLFVCAALITGAGWGTFLILNPEEHPLKPKEMFLTTTLIWVVSSFLAAVPYYYVVPNTSFMNALFESVSGLTTTGATIFSGLDTMAPGILLWRSMTQWIGGLGIIVMAILVLPFLRIGGMQLFSNEFSEQSERTSPKMIANIRAILYCFILLTGCCAGALFWAGMTPFDAINHALTCLSTGGFSTHDLSIGFFHNSKIEWVLLFFMTIAGLPLLMWSLLFHRQFRAIRGNSQIGLYLFFLCIALVVLVFWRFMTTGADIVLLPEIVRSAAFHIVSIVTTTGFCTENYTLWGTFAVMFFFILYFTGACTGSTSGGVKTFRYSILGKSVLLRLKNIIQPRAVFIARYDNKPITEDILLGVLVFFAFFCGVFAVGALALTAAGLDFITAISAAATAISNIGPGFGDIIGPDKTFNPLSDTAKGILCAIMIMGRLEFIAVIILFLPFLWRKNI